MFSQDLALLNNIFAVGNMQYPAVIVGDFLDHPGHFGSSDPLVGIFEFVGAGDVDAIEYLLDLGDGWHRGKPAVLLEVEPGE